MMIGNASVDALTHDVPDEQPSQEAPHELIAGAHILVPTKLDRCERSAMKIGLQMAAAHRATITVLHVSPGEPEANSVHWLDAIDNLNRTLSRPDGKRSSSADVPALERARAELHSFLERELPNNRRGSVNVRAECRVGDVAEEIARFADEEDVDLVILCRAPAPWWGMPIWRGLSPRIARLTKKPIVLVRPDADGLRVDEPRLLHAAGK